MGFLYSDFSTLLYLLALKKDWVPFGDRIELMFTFAVIRRSIFGRSMASVLLNLVLFQFREVFLRVEAIGWNSTLP